MRVKPRRALRPGNTGRSCACNGWQPLRRHATVSAADPTGEADLTVTAGSRDALVSLVCAAGADATVLEPDDVVSDVVESLRAVLAAHRVGDV